LASFPLDGRALVSRFWPVTVGQIQKGIVDRPVSNSRENTYTCVFQYTYEIDGKIYSNLVSVPADSEEDAQRLLKYAQGEKITVRYNLRHPEVSFLKETELAGSRISPLPQATELSPDFGASNLLDLSPNPSQKQK
jgi:hypothetical protein